MTEITDNRGDMNEKVKWKKKKKHITCEVYFLFVCFLYMYLIRPEKRARADLIRVTAFMTQIRTLLCLSLIRHTCSLLLMRQKSSLGLHLSNCMHTKKATRCVEVAVLKNKCCFIFYYISNWYFAFQHKLTSCMKTRSCHPHLIT